MNHYFINAKKILNEFFSFFAGEICYICKKKPTFICDDCVNKLPYLLDSYCNMCLSYLGNNIKNDLYCGECLKKPPLFKRAFAIFWYEGEIKEIMHEMKFKNKFFYVKNLMNIQRDAIDKIFKDIENIEAIVPIPLSNKRKLERGYNQSLLIAKELSKITGIPVNNNILKKKDIPPQIALSREDRFKNVKGAFYMEKKNCFDKIILVDDIITTTATIREAAKALKKGGCNEIYVFALCRAKN